MGASITLKHTIKKTAGGTVSLKLQTIAHGMSSKVFAIEVYPSSADVAAPHYRFSHVCSPSELVEFPEDDPRDNCYFRVDTVEFIFDTDKMIEHVMRNVRQDLSKLSREFNALENDAEVVTGTDEF